MRVDTGVNGLNRMLNGGFLPGRVVLLAGSAGTGKTTMAMQFIHNGIEDHDEPGVFITLEQNKDKIMADMYNLGMNLKTRRLALIGGAAGQIMRYQAKTKARLDDFLELGPSFFRFDDTRELYKALRSEIGEAGKNNKKINFPIKITSGALENAETKKLYNYILFSELYYDQDGIEQACKEILNNLKKVHLSDEIDYVRKKMLEYEGAKRDSSDKDKDKLDRKYDNLYQRLIKLEQEKLDLGYNK